MYTLDSLNNIITSDELSDLRKFFKNSKWNYKVPGGFLTNYPQRLVNVYGNGQYVNNTQTLEGHGWSSTYWTSKQTQNNITLETKTEKLPFSLVNIIPKLRTYLNNKFPINTMSEYTFNIAVCNNYIEPDMNIAAHTDDDYWYPPEIDNRPIFVSLTFYLDGTPIKDEHYSRFQLKINNKWIDLKLDDNSVLFINSDIPHRVLKHKKKDIPYFKPRINITLRSTYSIKQNPLLHNICVANHTRYYRNPFAIISNPNIESYKRTNILEGYNTFCEKNGYPLIKDIQDENHNKHNKKLSIKLYSKYIEKYNFDNILSFKSNIVLQTLHAVNNYIYQNL